MRPEAMNTRLSPFNTSNEEHFLVYLPFIRIRVDALVIVNQIILMNRHDADLIAIVVMPYAAESSPEKTG